MRQENEEEMSEGDETQVAAPQSFPLQDQFVQMMIFLYILSLSTSNLICWNACRGYLSFASRPDKDFILQIMRHITTNFCDSHTAPVPQELMSRIFTAIFEGPLRHARSTLTASFHNKQVHRIEEYG